MKRKVFLTVVFCLAFLISISFFLKNIYSQEGTVTTTIKILSVCGNGLKEPGEQCDGNDLGGFSCQSLGFSGGELRCGEYCIFDFSDCKSFPAGGGGGGGVVLESKIKFSGMAYPGSRIFLLKDGELAGRTVAGPDANFSLSFSGFLRGDYLFSLYSEDYQGRTSPLINFSVYVTPGMDTSFTGIFFALTITTDKIEVKRGDNIAILGQAQPEAEVVIIVNSQDEIFLKTSSDKKGLYFYRFDTTSLLKGEHIAKSKSVFKEDATGYSKTVNFKVGDKNILRIDQFLLKGDLNNDGRVNLIDFSIAVYWFNKPLSPTLWQIEKERLNGDGRINLIDFSIMAYYWTG